MFRSCGIVILLVLFFTACGHGGKPAVFFEVGESDFEESVLVEGTVMPVNTTVVNCPTGISNATVEYIVESGTWVKAGDVVCVLKSEEMLTTLDSRQVDLENSLVELEKTKSDMQMQYALLQAQVQSNNADAAISALDSLQLAYLSPSQRRIKEMELQTALIQRNKLDKKLKSLDVIQRTEIRKAEVRIRRETMRVEELKARIEMFTVKAPIAGLAFRGNNMSGTSELQVGDNVWWIQQLITIPETGSMKAVMMVSETDYKSIAPGDSVHYTFDAMPGNTGRGVITKKSPVGQAVKQGSKVKAFEIEASMDQVDTAPGPGISTDCRIILKSRPHAVAVPQIAVFEHDSIKVVYVHARRGYEQRQVVTSIGSPTEAVVEAGLAPGERIALTRPRESLVTATTLLPDSVTGKFAPPAPDPQKDKPDKAAK